MLRRFLNRRNEDLHLETFEIIQRIGPPAIPLLVELLRHEQVSFRRSAVNELIDLAPDNRMDSANYEEAYFWLSMSKDEDVFRDKVRKKLTPEKRVEIEQRAKAWQPKP